MPDKYVVVPHRPPLNQGRKDQALRSIIANDTIMPYRLAGLDRHGQTLQRHDPADDALVNRNRCVAGLALWRSPIPATVPLIDGDCVLANVTPLQPDQLADP